MGTLIKNLDKKICLLLKNYINIMYMQYLVEIILFLLFIYLASTENLQLSYLSSTYLGKVLLICLAIFLASFNLTYGVLAVVIYIVLTHKNLEFMEGMNPTEDEKDEK